MSWGEAIRLAAVLAADPSSQVGAAFAGWDYPASPEWMALHAMSSNFVATKTQRKPSLRVLPAPWDPKPVRWGTALSRDAFDATLAAHRANATSSVEEAQIRGGSRG